MNHYILDAQVFFKIWYIASWTIFLTPPAQTIDAMANSFLKEYWKNQKYNMVNKDVTQILKNSASKANIDDAIFQKLSAPSSEYNKFNKDQRAVIFAIKKTVEGSVFDPQFVVNQVHLCSEENYVQKENIDLSYREQTGASVGFIFDYFLLRCRKTRNDTLGFMVLFYKKAEFRTEQKISTELKKGLHDHMMNEMMDQACNGFGLSCGNTK